MRRIQLVLVALMAIGPCRKAAHGTAGTHEGDGVVHQGVGPECPNVWRITTDDGRMLWPVDDAAFHVEGLRVHFTVRERAGLATTCMAGTVVEVLSIRRR